VNVEVMVASNTSDGPGLLANDEDFDIPRLVPQLDEAALYGPIGTLVRIVEPFSEAHPAGILISILVGYGAMLGRGPFFKAGGVRHHANLFAMLVGATGDGRKGTCWSLASSILKEIDGAFMRDNVAGGLSSGEGVIAKIADRAEGGVTDSGSQDKRLLVSESEMSAPFKRMAKEGNSLSAVLRQAWDGETLSTLTKGAPGVMRGGMRASDPHVSLIAQVNPSELRRYLGGIELVNGFANRFLFTHVERVRICPYDESPPYDEMLEPIAMLRSALRPNSGGEVSLSADARELWSAELYPDLSRGAPGNLGALTTRGAPIVRRLAHIFALADGATQVLPQHLRAARAVWQYSRDSLGDIYGEEPLSQLAQRLLDAIVDAGAEGIPITALRATTGTKNIPSATRRGGIDELREAGLIKEMREDTGGRPSTRLLLTRHALPTRMANEAKRALRAISVDAAPAQPDNALNALNAHADSGHAAELLGQPLSGTHGSKLSPTAEAALKRVV
jgi:hypothetical protein